jgi:hypothetical protein
MKACGYPISDFEAQAADLSVDYPVVVEHYRAAHEIDLRLCSIEKYLRSRTNCPSTRRRAQRLRLTWVRGSNVFARCTQRGREILCIRGQIRSNDHRAVL